MRLPHCGYNISEHLYIKNLKGSRASTPHGGNAFQRNTTAAGKLIEMQGPRCIGELASIDGACGKTTASLRAWRSKW